jgi:hypothetical protein
MHELGIATHDPRPREFREESHARSRRYFMPLRIRPVDFYHTGFDAAESRTPVSVRVDEIPGSDYAFIIVVVEYECKPRTFLQHGVLPRA